MTGLLGRKKIDLTGFSNIWRLCSLLYEISVSILWHTEVFPLFHLIKKFCITNRLFTFLLQYSDFWIVVYCHYSILFLFSIILSRTLSKYCNVWRIYLIFGSLVTIYIINISSKCLIFNKIRRNSVRMLHGHLTAIFKQTINCE